MHKVFINTYLFLISPDSFDTGWHMKCHTIDFTHNTFLLLQKPLTSGTELNLRLENCS